MKLYEPPEQTNALPFWDASRQRRLVLPACPRDGVFWYPREVCPVCLGSDIEWRPASGNAVVYAVSVQHRPGPRRDAADGPYAVALVDLPEGVRVLTNVVGCPPEDVTVGQAVHVTWVPLADGRNLPMFTPEEAS
jgi:uncharacterized OB-fold protein